MTEIGTRLQKRPTICVVVPVNGAFAKAVQLSQVSNGPWIGPVNPDSRPHLMPN
jgi:hypothetical protein